MRPTSFVSGTLAYLSSACAWLSALACAQVVLLAAAQNAVAQNAATQNAGSLNKGNANGTAQTQPARLSDNSSTRIGLPDQSWTSNTAPRPTGQVAPSAVPLPHSNQQAHGNQQAHSNQLSQPAHNQSSNGAVAPAVFQSNPGMQRSRANSVQPAVLEQTAPGQSAMYGQVTQASAESGSPRLQAPGTRPLKPPSSSDANAPTKRTSSTTQMFISVVSSLLIVIGLLFGAAWFYRKATPNLSNSMPKDVVQVLGRTPLAPRQQLVLVRFGSKLVLVSNLQGEVRTISEITDPLEVDRMAGLCESAQPGSISNSFRSILHNLGRNES